MILAAAARLAAAFLLLVSSGASFGVEWAGSRLPPRQAMLLPGVREALPAGIAPYEGVAIPGRALLADSILATPATSEAGPRRLAVLVLEPAAAGSLAGSPPAMRARLVLMRQSGSRLAVELDRPAGAPNFLSMEMGPFGPSGSLALAVHWAGGPGPHEGPLEVWRLGREPPALALEITAEGFYFKDVDGDGVRRMVLYAPESDSLVCMPRVFGWSGGRLAPSDGAHDRLDRQLLADYDELLESYRAEAPPGDPPRMVMDVALMKGRLLERRREAQAAFLAYQAAIDLVPGGLTVAEADVDRREEILARAAEARRRAAALYGLPSGR